MRSFKCLDTLAQDLPKLLHEFPLPFESELLLRGKPLECCRLQKNTKRQGSGFQFVKFRDNALLVWL